MELVLSYIDPHKYVEELVTKYNFHLHNSCVSDTIMLPRHVGKGFVQVFVKRDIHFVRGAWDFNETTLFLSKDAVGQKGLIDFRISKSDLVIHSAVLEGENRFFWDITHVDGIRLFIPESYFGCDREQVAANFRTGRNDPQLKLLTRKIFSVPTDDFSKTLLFDAKLTEFIFYLIRSLQSPAHFTSENALDPACDDKRIRQVHAIILSNLDKEICITQLSRSVGINEFDLKRNFKQLYGLPIRQFTIREKIAAAFKLVTENNLSIADAGRTLGYTNVRHFEMLYRRYFDDGLSQFPVSK